MTKTSNISHKDILGNVIKVGDIVAYPDHNRMKIGVVQKLNPKMINVTAIGKKYVDRKYPVELLTVDDPKLQCMFLKILNKKSRSLYEQVDGIVGHKQQGEMNAICRRFF